MMWGYGVMGLWGYGVMGLVVLTISSQQEFTRPALMKEVLNQ